MIGVVESGNSGNVHRALRFVGQETETYDSAKTYEALVLPGIGNFGAFMRALPTERVRQHIEAGYKTLAICVGMQALYEGSEEAPERGLDLLGGVARKMEGRVPRVGWRYVEEFGSYMYFVHSYSVGADLVRYKETLATQFHPEKSGRAGLQLLKEFFG